MNFFRTLSISIGIFTISGCAQLDLAKGYNLVGETLSGQRVERTEDVMASWVGKDIDSLVAVWGAPSSTYKNKDGSIIYDYSYSTTKTRDAQYNVYGQVVVQGESHTSSCNKAFLVAPNGIISKWKVTTPRSCPYSGNKISNNIPIPESTF